MKAVEYFWSWFIEYHIKFKKFRTLSRKEQNHYSFWMKWHLHFYAPGVDYIIKFPQDEKDKIQLIITAHGDSQYFYKVEELVHTAPKLKEWEISAFIQPFKNLDILRQGLDKPYVFDDLSIKMSEIKFVPLPDPAIRKVHLTLYIAEYKNRSENENLLILLLLMLQDLLGEKTFYEHIDHVHVVDIVIEEEEEGCLLPLYSLPEYILSKK